MNPPAEQGLVCLEGSPVQVGGAFGAANGPDIRAEVEAFFGGLHSRDALLRAAEHYRSLVERCAPHWLDEAERARVEAAALEKGRGQESRQLLTDGCLRMAARAADYLKTPIQRGRS